MPDGPGEREGALDYEELVASGDPAFEFPDLDENTAAAMCYTSGTTGRPKGVLYSQRSIVLHTLGAALPDSMGIREADSVMPVVPMFHAMGWGIPYIATMLGARQVLPGPDLTPARAGRPDRLRGRHLERRRADDLERLPGARSAARSLQRARAQGGWLRGAGAPDPRLRGALRRAHRPGLGNDRDQPARRRLAPARGGRPLRRRGLRPASQPRAASCRWSSSGSTRTRAASCRSVARGSRAPTTRTRAATRGSPTTDGCAPATSPSCRATRSSGSSTAPRTSSSRAANGSRRSSSRTRSWPTPTSSRRP